MWDKLFKNALRILDDSGLSEKEWTLGGGTALALRFQHRESRAVDIFLSDAQYITLLTPRLNRTAAGMTDDYTEGSHFLKLRFPEGEVDFIIAPWLTQNPYEKMEVGTRVIQIETPEEIVVKKIFYRAEALKVRDVIDIAAVYAKRSEHLLNQAPIVVSRYEDLRNRWAKLQGIYFKEVEGLKILDFELAKKAPVLFQSFLHELGKRMVG